MTVWKWPHNFQATFVTSTAADRFRADDTLDCGLRCS